MRSRIIALILGCTGVPLGVRAQRSAPSLPIRGTAQTVTLPAPAGVTVQNDAGALTFSWQPVGGAIGYQVDAGATAAGPWTPLVAQPLAATTFNYTPTPGVLSYYRIAAMRSLGEAGDPAVVPFIYNQPFTETALSAVQSGADVTVSWTPVAGAASYMIVADAGSRREQVLSAANTSVTFPGIIGPGHDSRVALYYDVVAQFGRGVGESIGKLRGNAGVAVTDPALCWPASGTAGGPAPAALTSAPIGNAVALTWTVLGQVLIHRIERALGSSGKWEPVGCITQLFHGPFIDNSIALTRSTTYTYRVTAIGPNGVTGSTITSITTPPPETPIVAVHVNGQRVTLWLPPGTHARAYHISSSYGYRGVDANFAQTGQHTVDNVPLGVHRFTVWPLYTNRALGRGTTVTVTVQ